MIVWSTMRSNGRRIVYHLRGPLGLFACKTTSATIRAVEAAQAGNSTWRVVRAGDQLLYMCWNCRKRVGYR